MIILGGAVIKHHIHPDKASLTVIDICYRMSDKFPKHCLICRYAAENDAFIAGA